MIILTEEQFKEILPCASDCVVYNKVKYNSVLEAILNKDFILNNPTVEEFDCYYVFDYEAGVSELLRKLNPEHIFVWHFFGIDTYVLLNIEALDNQSERNKTPESLMIEVLSFLLKELNSTIKTPEGEISYQDLGGKFLNNIMKHELMGNASISGVSIRKWIDILSKINKEDDLKCHIISEKIGAF